jgi:hypothetical protein
MSKPTHTDGGEVRICNGTVVAGGHIAHSRRCPVHGEPTPGHPKSAQKTDLADTDLPSVYLVVMDRGGIFGVWLDVERAREAAVNIGGVLAVLPLVEDYRNEAS